MCSGRIIEIFPTARCRKMMAKRRRDVMRAKMQILFRRIMVKVVCRRDAFLGVVERAELIQGVV